MSTGNRDRALIEKYVKNIAFFRNISKKYRGKIVSDFTVISAKKNESILYQTDDSSDLYLVLTGSVRVTLISREGSEFILADLKAGDFFGEMSLIDGNPRSATVTAGEDSTLGVLKRRDFLEALRNEPEIAIGLLISLVNRLRQADSMIERFAFLDVRERLLVLLREFSLKEGERDERTGMCRIPKLTHKEIAGRIGVSREAVSKILKKLLISKSIIAAGSYYYIPDKLLNGDLTQ